jgi:hypothetical protein
MTNMALYHAFTLAPAVLLIGKYEARFRRQLSGADFDKHMRRRRKIGPFLPSR